MVPSINYFVRCVAPVCIEDEAHHFDQRVIEAAMDKLAWMVQSEASGRRLCCSEGCEMAAGG